MPSIRSRPFSRNIRCGKEALNQRFCLPFANSASALLLIVLWGVVFSQAGLKASMTSTQSDWRRNQPSLSGRKFPPQLQARRYYQGNRRRQSRNTRTGGAAWLLRQGPDIIPIPGTRHVQYLEENAKAADLNLPESAWSAVDKTLLSFKTAGLRYEEAMMKFIDTTE